MREKMTLELLYRQNVLNQLQEKLKSRGEIFKLQYSFESNGRKVYPDLAVLENGKITEIYEIRRFSTIAAVKNTLKALMEQYQEFTKAKVYLAYLDEDEKLKTLSVTEKEWTELNNQQSEVEFRVNNISDYYKKVKELGSEEPDEMKSFFRGHSSKDYDVAPSIYRGQRIEWEDYFFHETIRKLPNEFTEDMSTFDKLVKMQHYGLPTRLLDITSNPLVALYFACKSKDKEDGCVMMFHVVKEQIEYYDSDLVCALSNLAKCSKNFCLSKDKDQLVFDMQDDKPNFRKNRLDEFDLGKVICVMPKLNNNRIIRQQGAFFIFGMGETKSEFAKFLDPAKKIIIEAKYKKKILEDLAVMGFDEGSLFPEVDKVIEQIKKAVDDKCKKKLEAKSS